MGATREWKRGRHAVAIAAVLFYAFLEAWLPVNFAAPSDNLYQPAAVFNLTDDGDDDILSGAGDLAPAETVAPPFIGQRRAIVPSGAPSLRAHAPLVSRARDPPLPNV